MPPKPLWAKTWNWIKSPVHENSKLCLIIPRWKRSWIKRLPGRLIFGLYTRKLAYKQEQCSNKSKHYATGEIKPIIWGARNKTNWSRVDHEIDKRKQKTNRYVPSYKPIWIVTRSSDHDMHVESDDESKVSTSFPGYYLFLPLLEGGRVVKFLKKLWCCVGLVWLYQLNWKCKLATVTS